MLNLFPAQTTKVELAATRGVVAEQASTEGTLLSEAAQTAESLGAAERDVEGLLDKVTRQVGGGGRSCAGAVVGCYRKEARDGSTSARPTRLLHKQVCVEIARYVYGKAIDEMIPKPPFLLVVQAWLWSNRA